MELHTKRLFLRPWRPDDAEDLYRWASDPDVGPSTGWLPHKSIEESRFTIENILNGPECYAICIAGTDTAIGSIELMLNGMSDKTGSDRECELGFWLAKPYWGRGYMPEASEELLRHGFEDLHMDTVWCGHFEDNAKSARAQEKIGFVYDHTMVKYYALLDRTITDVVNVMTKEQWEKREK